MNTEYNITSQPWIYGRRPDLECGDLVGHIQLPTYALDVVAPSGAAPIFNEALEKIVTAVNCHNELLKALQDLLFCYENADERGYVTDEGFIRVDDIKSDARQAIAQALNQQQ